MKSRYIHLILLVCWSSPCWTQQIMSFSSYHKVSKHYVKAEARVARHSDYKLQFEQEFTSILVKILPQASFLKSYILVNGDTMRFKRDGLPYDPMQGSQLIVFKKPVSRFQLHTSDLFGLIEFHLYNSEPQVAKVHPSDHAEKVSEETLSASLVILDRKESMHRNTTLARHPDVYSKKKRKLIL